MSDDTAELEALKEEYLSQLRGVFPLHRAALFAIVLLVVVTSKDMALSNATMAITGLKIASIWDMDSPGLAMATLGDALISAAILLLGTLLQRAIRTWAFTGIRKRLRLDEMAKKMLRKSAHHGRLSVGDYFSLKKAESDARMWGKRVATFSLLSEGTTALFLAFLYAGVRLREWFDPGIAFVFLFLALAALFRSFVVFLRHYLPHLMHQKGLTGQPADVELPS